MGALVPRLELRQSQSLVMTQQLQQSIRLLQLSSQELMAFVEQELEKNPLLTQEDAESADAPAEEAATEEEDEISAISHASGEGEWHEEEESGPSLNSFGDMPYGMGSSSADEDNDNGFESYTASKVSLRDFLLEQLHLQVSDPMQRMIGQHFIDLVDESGYIKDDVSTIADQLNCPQELIDSTFALLQRFEPVGVCARTLSECLAIQLREKNRLDPAMECLLQNLDLVAKGEIKTLTKLCGVDEQDVHDMCREIRALNPRPGSGYEHETVSVVIPDVFLKRTKQGWQVELNPQALPKALVNQRYYSLLISRAQKKQERKYISDQLAAAHWLVKALEQRANTILKVATEIVAHQDGFFREGIKYLRPLTLKEVAAATQLHESTVSRVTMHKYMNTPRGTFELKYFFNASIQNTSGGEGYSNKTVQHHIKELVNKETAAHIHSDDEIAAQLKMSGIDIARRTVAKYREQLHIPSSAERKRIHKGKKLDFTG